MRFLIGLMTAMMITGIACAQHSYSPAGHVNIGIKGGLNAYNIHNDNNLKYERKIGFHAGLLGHIHLSNRFALQPEIVYSTEGAKHTISNVTTEYNLEYINVPLLLQYMFDNGFRLQVGPQVGFLLNAKSKDNNATTNITNDLKPTDVAVSFGMSYVYAATGFGIDARYNLGVGTINKNSNVNSTNRGFQLGFFYFFGE